MEHTNVSSTCPHTESDNLSTGQRILFHTPLFIFCLIVLLLGITGNVTVLYIYTRRLKVLIFGFFIKVLAIFDIITTCTAIPCILAFRLVPFLIDCGIICKVITVIKHVSALNSGIIFIVIAVQRFRKMCRPHKSQISEALAKKLVLLSVGLSIVGSIPIIFFVGERQIMIEWYNHNVTVSVCDFIVDKGGYLSTVYTVWVSVELVGITTTLAILYSSIARAVRIYALKRGADFQSTSSRRFGRRQTSTVIFFVLTVVFLVTSTPMVVVSMYFSRVDVDCQWSYAGITVYDLSVDLLFINGIVNPIVYSFNSVVFRRECRAIFSSRRETNGDSQIKTSQQTSMAKFINTSAM